MRKFAFLLLGMILATSVSAQQKIENVIKKIEAEGVNGSLVVKRDKKSKKVSFKARDFNFISKDGNYARKLKEAFEKESENATETYINTPSNNIVFYNGQQSKNDSNVYKSTLVFVEGNIKWTYVLTITPLKGNDKLVTLQVIMKDKSVKLYYNWDYNTSSMSDITSYNDIFESDWFDNMGADKVKEKGDNNNEDAKK